MKSSRMHKEAMGLMWDEGKLAVLASNMLTSNRHQF